MPSSSKGNKKRKTGFFYRFFFFYLNSSKINLLQILFQSPPFVSIETKGGEKEEK